MNPSEPPIISPRFRKRYVILVIGLAIIGLAVFGVTGFCRLGSETTALRRSLTSVQHVGLDKRISVSLGGFSTALVRFGMRYAKIPPEAHAAVEAIRGAEVGVYKLRQASGPLDTKGIFASADKAMSARAWERVVGVATERELVAVYLPRKGFSSEHMRCCVMVLHDRELVVASARGNLESVLNIARQRLDLPGKLQEFAKR